MMKRNMPLSLPVLLTLILAGGADAQGAGVQTFSQALSDTTPENFNIAFTGDTDVNSDAEAVLTLILNEGADALIHNGDLGYGGTAQAFEDQIDAILGPDYPYFYSAGNHDRDDWYIADGYKELGEARMNRLGITWDGDYGVRSSLYYHGMFIILVGPDIFSDQAQDHDVYIRDQLAQDNSIWRISSWHKNMNAMQVYKKDNETGWGVYEESRKGGAIITTGHAHTYSRSYQMNDLDDQVIATTSDTVMLSRDLPETTPDEGNTFVHVSGLGGRNVKEQLRDGAWWASIYTSTQNATYGALFGVFNYNGDETLAYFYFKNIDGEIIDEFYARSSTRRVGSVTVTVTPDSAGSVNMEPGGGTYEIGTKVSVFALASEGYLFDRWEGDLTGPTNPDSLVIDSDKAVTAVFAALPSYALTTSVSGSGSIALDPAGGFYLQGSEVFLTASADSGYQFDGWSGDLVSVDNPATIMMDSDKNISATFSEAPTGIRDHVTAPLSFELHQNYPNPFNPATTIRYVLPDDLKVLLTIYNVHGQAIKRLVNDNQPAGNQTVIWDGRDDAGNVVSSGLYIYRLQIDDRVKSMKMLFLK